MTRKLVPALLGAAAAMLLGSVAWAAIPDQVGVIHACYAKPGGALRVLDSDEDACKAHETELAWSQAGQPSAVAGYQIVSGDAVTLAPGTSGEAQVACPAGKRALGGGYIADPSVQITSVIPAGAGTIWSAAGFNDSAASNAVIRTRVICAVVSP